MNAMLRHWLLLRSIPRAPRKVAIGKLRDLLDDEGIRVTTRTLQRDLHELSEVFPIACDDRHKPYGWSWDREQAGFDLPAMEPRTALTVHMVRTWLDRLLPRSTWHELEPQFQRAEQVLAGLPEHPFTTWSHKVRVVSPGPQERVPPIIPEVLDAVYEGLLREQRVQVTYRARSGDGTKTYDVHPLGIVLRAPLVYLVCVVHGRDNPVQLVLSRALAAEVQPEPREVPAGFTLDAWLARGSLDMVYGDAPVALVARVDRVSAWRLGEAPLSDEQELTDDGDHVILRVTLPDTFELRRWVLSWGSHLEVVEPAWLRDEMTAELVRATARYHRPDPA